MTHLFHRLALCVCVLAIFFVSCSDDSTDPTPNNLPATTHFYAKWVNDDSVEIFYSFGPWGTLPDRLPTINTIRIYQWSPNQSSWKEVIRTTPNSYQDSLTSKINAQPASNLLFFRIEYEVATSGIAHVQRGPIIATSKPLQYPASWENGTTLRGNADVYIHDGGSSCLSEDGLKIFAPLNKGVFFDISSGLLQDGTRDYTTADNVVVDWIDTTVIFSGTFIYTVSQRALNRQIFGMFSSYSYRNDDTSYIYYKDKLTYRYRLTSGTFVRDSSVGTPPSEVSMTVPSPSHKYYGCISSFWKVFGTEGGWRLLDTNLQPLVALYPFGDYAEVTQYIDQVSSWDRTPLYMQWAVGDDQVYFWADWSGCMEIWTYSISKKRYDQITGYRASTYPGRYYEMEPTYLDTEVPSPEHYNHRSRVNTINFLYHPGKKKLMLFFRQGERNFAVRYADLPQ